VQRRAAVVLHHHLLYGNSIMTLITFQDGKPVLRDGKVGTESGCCCCDPNCLTLFAVFDKIYSGGGCQNVADSREDEINAEIDFDILYMQTLADNLSAIGWTASVEVVARNLVRLEFECIDFPGCPNNQCFTLDANWIVRLTATCSCCVKVPSLNLQNCRFDLPSNLVPCQLFDQPDGVWALVTPTAVIPEGMAIDSPVQFGPTCAPWHPMWAPYGINGEYGDYYPDIGLGIWVPVCTGSEWCENPLP
jgi:hypothetical protein